MSLPAAQTVLPVVERQHDDGVRSRLPVVGLLDGSSERGAYAEHAEVRARDDLGAHGFGRVPEREVDRGRGAPEHAVEHVGLVAQILVEGMRHQIAAAPAVADKRPAPVQQDEPVGLADGQLSKERLVDQREDGGVRADAQADRQQSCEGKPSVLEEAPQAELDVASKACEHCAGLDGFRGESVAGGRINGVRCRTGFAPLPTRRPRSAQAQGATDWVGVRILEHDRSIGSNREPKQEH